MCFISQLKKVIVGDYAHNAQDQQSFNTRLEAGKTFFHINFVDVLGLVAVVSVFTPIFLDTSVLVCHWPLQTIKGWIQSPGFPTSYPDNVSCLYEIQMPTYQAGYFFTFTFDSFELQEPDSEGSCIYDYLEVRYGFNSCGARFLLCL